jgi:septal ring factor EnvC (AmiA/AmiB activator)
MDSRNITVFGVLLAILAIVAGGLYVRALKGDQNALRQQLVAAATQSQALKANLTAAEKEKSDAIAARNALETKLAEATRAQASSTNEGTASNDEMTAMQAELAQARTELKDARQIAGYWRDLYDYTKPFPPTLTADGSPTRLSAAAKAQGEAVN